MTDDATVDETADLAAASVGVTTPGGARGGAEPPVDVGMLLGRYQLRERLGEGGMGVVFAAYDPGLDRTVAVKVLRPGLGGGEEPHQRLQREGRVMARLSHPNVMPVFDVGFAHGSVFVAMEYVRGQTVEQWLQTARTLPEILGVFVQAAAGLAAAHDAGFVHRDFKPSNVMIGDDGRVLVSDFGVARPVGEETAGSTSLESSSTGVYATLTRADAVVGTPAYMAPEQHAGGVIDARADQFGFCVALWRALYGQPPFAGSNVRELAESVRVGTITEPPPRGVPPRIRAVLERGLSVDPAARFPSMHAVRDALVRPERRRGAIVAALSIAAIAVVVAGVWLMSRGEAHRDPCAVTADRFAGIWDAEARTAVAQAFARTGLDYAASAAAEVTRQLDARRGAWEAMRRDSCEATRVRHEHSDAAMDLRTACLDRRLTEIAAFVAVLREADAPAVQSAATQAAGVGDVAECGDVAARSRRAPLPSDPGARAEIAAIEQALAELAARAETGSARELGDEAGALLARARAAGYAPVVARALQLVGVIDEKSDRTAEAEKAYDEAVLAAEAGGDDALRFDLEARQIRLVGLLLDRDQDGRVHADRAEALLHRLGDEPRRAATLDRARSIAAWAAGRYDDALAHATRAIETLERIDPAGTELASAYHMVAIVHDDQHNPRDGLPAIARALEVGATAFGTGHPKYAQFLQTQGGLLRRDGRLAEAEANFTRSLTIIERINGPESNEAGAASLNLANLQSAQGRLDDAIATNRRSVAIYEKVAGPDHSLTANALDGLGGKLSKAGRADEAEQTLRRAIAIYRDRKGADAPQGAITTRHLAEHFVRVGRHADALPLFEEAVRALTASQGPTDSMLAKPLLGAGRAHLALGHAAEARVALERALTVCDDDELRAEIEEALAGATIRARR